MEKDSSKVEKKEVASEKQNKHKELILTIVVLLISIIVGFLIGKALFEAMYR